MNQVKYRAFMKAIELNSISKAADALGYSQPGVSHMIESLEKEYGFPLLIRTRDSITPTENGRQLLHYCNAIIQNEDALQETVSSINGMLSGTLRIGAFNCMLMKIVPDIVAGFLKKYPGIRINLSEFAYEDCVDSLAKGDIDLAFMSDDVPKGFEFHAMCSDPAGVILPREHPLTRYDRISVNELAKYPVIMPMPGWDDIVHLVFKDVKEYQRSNIRIASDSVAIQLVERGLGVFILSQSHDVNLPDTVSFRPIDIEIPRKLGICTRKMAYASPAVKKFVEYTKEYDI